MSLVPVHTLKRLTTALACLACTFFILAGLAIIPQLGIEGDETLFAAGIYPPRGELYAMRIGHSHVPLMLMSYVGALKSWLYTPILSTFGTGPYTLRIPVLLIGAVSVWVFFLLLRRTAGDLAALIGCGLLAVDSMYLVTICFDWGPVALQHLLIASGALYIVRFFQERQPRWLFWGFFLLGLAMWDKALAVWLLSGMGIATLLTFPRQVLGAITRRNVGIAVLAFILGALPLLAYNSKHHWVTFRGNFHRDTTLIAAKATFLMNTAGGPGLFGWMTSEDFQTPDPHSPDGWSQSASARISAIARHPRQHLLLYGFCLALVLLPLVRGLALRIVVFSLIAMAVAWIQMAITANTGASVHHTILLWPFPELVIAVSFASAARRLGRAGIPAVAVLVLIMMVSGALVINEYYAVMVRNGGSQGWNSAIFPLSRYLKDVPSTRIVCMDWGIMEPLQFLNQGALPLAWADDAVAKQELTDTDRRHLLDLISTPGFVFLAHTRKYEVFPGRSPNLVKFAESSGYRREMLKVVDDGFGRDFFEVYRFVHGSGGG